MSLTGGKRKVNKSLKAWVTFVKKVQKEENLSYKDAIHRAKVRKDKGEKWMMGGQTSSSETMGETMGETMEGGEMTSTPMSSMTPPSMDLLEETEEIMGGKRRRTMRRGRGRTQQQQQQRQRGRTQQQQQQRQRGRTQRRRQQQQRQRGRASRRY